MSRYNPIEKTWSAATVNLPVILLQLDDQAETEREDGGYVSQSEEEVEAEVQHQDADIGHEEENDAGKEDEAGSEGAKEDTSNSK